MDQKIRDKIHQAATRSGNKYIASLFGNKPKRRAVDMPQAVVPTRTMPVTRKEVVPPTMPMQGVRPQTDAMLRQMMMPTVSASMVPRQRMNVGGMAEQPMPMEPQAPAPEQQVEGPVGFIEKSTAETTPAETVADDVPMDVPEGSFIINGPAAEFAGTKDIRRMLEDAVEEAKKQGIDIGASDSTMSNEEYVALLVSKGEVVVPPALAKIIGYDKLNKINERGKEEVARRAQEAEQQQQQPAQAMQGGFIAMRDGGTVNIKK